MSTQTTTHLYTKKKNQAFTQSPAQAGRKIDRSVLFVSDQRAPVFLM